MGLQELSSELFRRFWLLLCNNPLEYANEVFYSLFLSLALGTVYYELTTVKYGEITDRFGLFYSLLTLFLLPNLWLNIDRSNFESQCRDLQMPKGREFTRVDFFADFSERLMLHPDSEGRLYNKVCFLVGKVRRNTKSYLLTC